MAAVAHDYGPRRQSRLSLLLLGRGPTLLSELWALSLGDMGSSSVKVLQRPTRGQLADALADLEAAASASEEVEDVCVSFSGCTWHPIPAADAAAGGGGGSTGNTGSAGAAPPLPPLVLVLEVAPADKEAGDPMQVDGAAGPPATATAISSKEVQLASPLEALRASAAASQTPLLLQVDGLLLGQQQQASEVAAAGSGLRDSTSDSGGGGTATASFQHTTTALAKAAGGPDGPDAAAAAAAAEEALVAWSYLLFKHTFLRWHPAWRQAHAAASEELAASGLLLQPGGGSGGGGGGAGLSTIYATPDSNADLFKCGGMASAQHHRVLQLLADISSAASSAPRSPRTAALLRQLRLLLADTGGPTGQGWRPFVLRWGLLTLNSALQDSEDDGGGAQHTTSTASGRELDQRMRGELRALFAAEVSLPGALLALAGEGSPAVVAAAGGVMASLPPLTDYGRLPGEAAGQPDAARRSTLAAALLAASAAPKAAAGGGAGARLQGNGGSTTTLAVARPLFALPFVAGFIEAAGLGDELAAAQAAAGPEAAAAWRLQEEPEAAPAAGAPTPPLLEAAGRRGQQQQLPPAKRVRFAAGGSEEQQEDEQAPPAAAAAQAADDDQALVVVDLPSMRVGGSRTEDAEAQVPANVESLRVADIVRVAPLLRLHDLRVLSVASCSTPAAELAALRQHRSLTHVSLTYSDAKQTGKSAPAWPRIPLRSLTLGCATGKYQKLNTNAVMDALRQLRLLTRLTITARMATLSPGTLAASLAACSALRVVSLRGMSAGEGLPPAAAAAGWQQVLRALASLPNLESLDLSGVRGAGVSAGELAACGSTRLTSLSLARSGLTDDALAQLATPASATLSASLRALDVSDSGSYGYYASAPNAITDGGVAVAGLHLTGLTALVLGARGSAAAPRLVTDEVRSALVQGAAGLVVT